MPISWHSIPWLKACGYRQNMRNAVSVNQLALLLSLIALAVGAVIPWQAGSQVGKMMLNLSHPIGFALLGGLLIILMSTFYSQASTLRTVASAFACLLAVAVTTEAIQTLLPHRSANLHDIYADLLGGVAGGALVWAIRAHGNKNIHGNKQGNKQPTGRFALTVAHVLPTQNNRIRQAWSYTWFPVRGLAPDCLIRYQTGLVVKLWC